MERFRKNAKSLQRYTFFRTYANKKRFILLIRGKSACSPIFLQPLLRFFAKNLVIPIFCCIFAKNFILS